MFQLTTQSKGIDFNQHAFHRVVVDWINGKEVNWKITICLQIL